MTGLVGHPDARAVQCGALCGDCGVLVAVVFEDGARTYAAVNARCLEVRDGFAPVVPASPQKLEPDEKTARWRQLWIADVRWTTD